jgi:hypothetical protein
MSNKNSNFDCTAQWRVWSRAKPNGVNTAIARRTSRGEKRMQCRRRGVVSLWLIVTLPVLLILVCLLIEVGNIWLARVELENALEAAALSAVKEWGDQGGGDTLTPRNVGVTYAAENTMSGSPVLIDANYLMTAGVNQNADCMGDLIFGAITTDVRPWVFEAGVSPSCGGGAVLFDATGQGNLKTDDDRWGIAFRLTAMAPPGILIEWVEIDLAPAGAVFNFSSDGPQVSDNLAPRKVRDKTGYYDQEDIGGAPFGSLPPGGGTVVGSPGFTDPANQILFSPSSGTPTVLRIDFVADGTADTGFAPGDRFRFGASAARVVGSGRLNDVGGDDVAGAEIRVKFNNSPIVFTTSLIDDTTARQSDCADPGYLDPLGEGQLVVHPSMEPDLPCPETSSANNNGQSWVVMSGGLGRAFGVRAQATEPVGSVCCHLFDMDLNIFNVSACATARYDCIGRRPELIRVRPENFLCP